MTTDGVELSAGHFQAGELIAGRPGDYDDRPGALRLPAVDAVAEALTRVADAVNTTELRYSTAGYRPPWAACRGSLLLAAVQRSAVRQGWR
ncbi:hypothetical protein [Krasilnikovia sp. MM14-A1259]|uniref:hypothetical protein n=1 Tax=Krasilnikovia sp. MM14-A1259 TaxID=3373539 RepID=UPI003821084E